MRYRGWRWAAIVASGLSLARSSAAEPSADDAARRTSLLRSGASAAKSKDWPACIDAYAKAAEIQGDSTTFGELGLCEVAAGRYTSAHPHLKRATAGLSPGDPRRKAYQAALGEVADNIAIVVLTVTPLDARVVVDGKPLGRGEGQHIALMPGRHVFSARHDGYEDLTKTITVEAREIPNVDLSLIPKAKPTAPVSSSGQSHRANSASSRPASPAASPFPCLPAWSVRGMLVPAACLGAALFTVSAATAIGLEVHAMSLRSKLDARGFKSSSCAPGQPQAGSPDCTEIVSRMQQRTDAANVLIASGIAAGALAVGAGLSIALDRPGAKLAATVGADGGGLIFQGTW